MQLLVGLSNCLLEGDYFGERAYGWFNTKKDIDKSSVAMTGKSSSKERKLGELGHRDHHKSFLLNR